LSISFKIAPYQRDIYLKRQETLWKSIRIKNESKIYHLNKWLDKQQVAGIAFKKTYAYSDSKNDIPLLEWADVAICVSPDDALHAHALAHHWAVEDWSI